MSLLDPKGELLSGARCGTVAKILCWLSGHSSSDTPDLDVTELILLGALLVHLGIIGVASNSAHRNMEECSLAVSQMIASHYFPLTRSRSWSKHLIR